MSGVDRRPHESATILDQQFLNYSQDNLENELRLIVEIERPQEEEERFICNFSISSPGEITSEYINFKEADPIIFETSGSLPTGISAGTTYYVRNPLNGTFNISATPTSSLLNFVDSGSGAHRASNAAGLIRVSDRHTFVGDRFYEARTSIPTITRTVGEWLRPIIEFSSLQLMLSNVDKRYSGMVPGGDNFDGQVNNQLTVKLGLRDVESTYFTIFSGYISEVGGFKRDITAVKYVARDRFDQLNVKYPNTYFNVTDYPKISDDVLGLPKPIIYGDFTVQVETEGNVPAQIVNKADPQLYYDRELPVDVYNGTPTTFVLENQNFDDDDKVRFTTDGVLPSPLSSSTDYYIVVVDSDTFSVAATAGGAALATTGGSGQTNVVAQDLVNVGCVISENALSEFNTSEVWLSRSDIYYKISSSDIVNVGGDLNYFEIAQNTGNTPIDGDNYIFQSSDKFLVKVKGKDLSGYDDNPVWQARDLLLEYTDITAGEFDSNWETYRDKSTPAQSAVSSIKSRIWIQEQASVLEYALSLLEQIRLEMFISRDLKLKINSLHLEDFDTSPSHILRNFDVVKGSLQVSIDERNNFNRAQGFYDFNPYKNDNNKLTSVYRNQTSINQINKDILKTIEFPNLYIASDVANQVSEILRLSSGMIEILDLEVTARQVLLDIGDFMSVNIQIDSTVYDNIPMLIREIGYTSNLRLPIKLWSMQMIPFGNPGGWNPSYNGITGGDLVTISEE